MENTKLHIVAFDIPYPPDYGGAIDVFNKVRSLSAQGAQIYLHCPRYGGRQPSGELEALCAQVFYYERKTGLRGISLKLPYMVYSRRDEALLNNLIRIDAPVLFDGVSTSYYLSHPALKKRLKILRPQNVEQHYYRQLAAREGNWLKRIYYKAEAHLLAAYEDRLQSADAFFTVALHDHTFFRQKYPSAIHEYIPSFQPYDELCTREGMGSFCLYHGNLALAENREAVIYLLEKVIPHITQPFVIAGRNPDEELLKLAGRYPHCSLVPNPSMAEMEQLIRDAHIHVLPTFQNTGLKLKLLHALFNGRHIVVNREMVHGTGLENICTLADTAQQTVERIGSLRSVPVDKAMLQARADVLAAHYDNKKNAEKILTFLRQRSL